jgi:type IV secretion system protein VirB8
MIFKKKPQEATPQDKEAVPGSEKNAEKPVNPKRLPQSFMEAAKDFETFKIEQLKARVKTAWAIAAASGLVAVICIVGILMSFALHKEPAPVVLKVDNGTGNVEMLRSVKDENDTYDEVINRYWLAQYVRTCERYDWYTISVDYQVCELFGTRDVFSAYAAKWKEKNSPLNQLRDKGKIDVRIVSISFLNANTAQVRFTTQKLNAAGENPDGTPLQRWIATVVYEYRSILMTERQRLVNPLGFKVLSFKRDPESLRAAPSAPEPSE